MDKIYGIRFLALRVFALGVVCGWYAPGGVAQATTSEPAVKPVAVKVFEIGAVSHREFSRRWKRENWDSLISSTSFT